mmetsp:Transcript_17151/g.16372  ORF Transcript_17151/g.16372 Transcript_17151/m.16372 type:complete len:124 (+) Transcript_17151:334-705(+)
MVAIITVVVESVPVSYIPFRAHIIFILFGRETCSNKENLVCTAIFVTLTCLIAIVYPNISQVLSIIGGFCACNLSYLIPIICYVQLSGKPLRSPKVMISVFVFGILFLIGYGSVFLSIYQIAK